MHHIFNAHKKYYICYQVILYLTYYFLGVQGCPLECNYGDAKLVASILWWWLASSFVVCVATALADPHPQPVGYRKSQLQHFIGAYKLK